MAEGENGAIDLGAFVPDTFKGEDGTYDTAKFRTSYDELAAFKGQDDDRRAQLPQKPEDYAFALPETHAWPEGFDPATMGGKDEAGNAVAFDPASLLDPKDPDVSALQVALHKSGASAAVMADVASIFVNRGVRAMMDQAAVAAAETQKLGPEGQARIATLTRALNASLPAAQATALLNSISSADALRGIEEILKTSRAATVPAPGPQDYSAMTPLEQVMAGLQQRSRA